MARIKHSTPKSVTRQQTVAQLNAKLRAAQKQIAAANAKNATLQRQLKALKQITRTKAPKRAPILSLRRPPAPIRSVRSPKPTIIGRPAKLHGFKSPKQAPLVKIPRKIILKKSDDIIARLRALEKIGAYKPKRRITRKNITRSQIRTIANRFADIMRHGINIKGHTVKPFSRHTHGYVLNKPFQFVRGKVKHGTAGAIKTHTGAIVQSFGENLTVDENGNLVAIRKIGHHKRKVIAQTLSNKQVLEFLKAIENGTLKIEKGWKVDIDIFGNQSPRTYHTVQALRDHFAHYISTLRTAIKKHPHMESPLTLEFHK